MLNDNMFQKELPKIKKKLLSLRCLIDFLLDERYEIKNFLQDLINKEKIAQKRRIKAEEIIERISLDERHQK